MGGGGVGRREEETVKLRRPKLQYRAESASDEGLSLQEGTVF